MQEEVVRGGIEPPTHGFSIHDSFKQSEPLNPTNNALNHVAGQAAEYVAQHKAQHSGKKTVSSIRSVVEETAHRTCLSGSTCNACLRSLASKISGALDQQSIERLAALLLFDQEFPRNSKVSESRAK